MSNAQTVTNVTRVTAETVGGSAGIRVQGSSIAANGQPTQAVFVEIRRNNVDITAGAAPVNQTTGVFNSHFTIGAPGQPLPNGLYMLRFRTQFDIDNNLPGVFRNIRIGPLPDGEILLGDCNLDGVVNFLDISPFVALLANGTYMAECDINQDGVVDFSDNTLFTALLGGIQGE